MSRKPATKGPGTPATSTHPEVSGRFFVVGKESHLLYSAWEIEVKDGVVVGVKGLSRAPDLAASAVGACTREIWVALRTQEALRVDP